MKTIHKFEMNGKKLLLDINSGAVHIIDDLIWDILDKDFLKTKSDVYKDLGHRYPKEAIDEAYDELKYLEEKGLLFSKNNYRDDVQYNSQNIIKAMCLHVAHDCNLKCNYCFASQGDFQGDKLLMSVDVGKKALEFLIEHSGNRKNLEVDFFGGEPLMNFEVVKSLVDYGRSLEDKYNKKFRFTLTTNGVLLDDKKMAFMNEHMDNVVLSLDGRKEVNDFMRKTLSDDGSYDVIVPKFQSFVKLRGDKSYYVRGTFTKENLDFSKDVLAIKELGFNSISVEPVVAPPDKSYGITEEDLDNILKEYEHLSQVYLKQKKENNDFDFFHFMIDLKQGPCAIKRVSGCGAGGEYIAVTPEGDIYPCHQFVGNDLFKLGDLFKGIVNTELRDTFNNTNVFTKEGCGSCWARFYCSGGCHANAYNFNEDITKPDKIGCEMEKKRIECALSIAANQDWEGHE